jgi:MFS transporter, DHA1 family, inner membrane transport protein
VNPGPLSGEPTLGVSPQSVQSPQSLQSSQRVPLVFLTALKFATNGLLRLPYPFIGDLARGLHTTTASIGAILSAGELTGLVGSVVGHDLDRGRHRRWLTVGFAMCGVGGGVVAGLRSSIGLLIGFCLISIGVTLATTAGHSFIGSVTPFSRRGRSIGIFETSWALSLLLGGYVAGRLIDAYDWWVPFAVFGTALLIATPFLRYKMNALTVSKFTDDPGAVGVFELWVVARVISLSIVVTFAQVLLFSTMGPFLEHRHGFDTKSIGLVVFGLGCLELVGSGATATLTDRLGKRNAVLGGLVVMASAAALLVLFGGASTVAAVMAILGFFLGFEFSYVSLLTVVSEVGGPRRGAVLSVDHAAVTATRAAGAFLGPWFVGKHAENFRSLYTMMLVGTSICLGIVLTLRQDKVPSRKHPVSAK